MKMKIFLLFMVGTMILVINGGVNAQSKYFEIRSGSNVGGGVIGAGVGDVDDDSSVGTVTQSDELLPEIKSIKKVNVKKVLKRNRIKPNSQLSDEEFSSSLITKTAGSYNNDGDSVEQQLPQQQQKKQQSQIFVKSSKLQQYQQQQQQYQSKQQQLPKITNARRFVSSSFSDDGSSAVDSYDSLPQASTQKKTFTVSKLNDDNEEDDDYYSRRRARYIFLARVGK